MRLRKSSPPLGVSVVHERREPQPQNGGGGGAGDHRCMRKPRLPLAWWRRADSNRRPPACKAGALPTELRPHVYLRKHPTASLAQKMPPWPAPYQQRGHDGRNYPGLLRRWRAPGLWVEKASDGSDSEWLDPWGAPRTGWANVLGRAGATQ